MKNAVLMALAVAAATVALDANARKPVQARPAAAQAPEPVAVDVPPPSGTWEAKPPVAEGYVWSAGFHEWKDGHYAWKPGEWVLAKPGMEYRQRKWVRRADGKWILTGGDWVTPTDKLAGKQ